MSVVLYGALIAVFGVPRALRPSAADDRNCSDHHANPTRRYHTLRSMEGAPNPPSGYASMIGLTYPPPLWRRVMDHRVVTLPWV